MGGNLWLAGLGISVLDLDDRICVDLLARFIKEQPDLWDEDIGL
jgi:cytosine deaminase